MNASAPGRRTNVSAGPIFDRPYRDANGLLLMCMYCHRTRRNLPNTDQWDWVEAYAADTPERTSHGICKDCLDAALQGKLGRSACATEVPHRRSQKKHVH